MDNCLSFFLSQPNDLAELYLTRCKMPYATFQAQEANKLSQAARFWVFKMQSQFGWGYARHPTGETYDAPQIPQSAVETPSPMSSPRRLRCLDLAEPTLWNVPTPLVFTNERNRQNAEVAARFDGERMNSDRQTNKKGSTEWRRIGWLSSTCSTRWLIDRCPRSGITGRPLTAAE